MTRIAIIGTGGVGAALARGWVKTGHQVVLAVRQTPHAKADALRRELGDAVAVDTVAAAAAGADVVVLATPWPATEDAVRAAGDLTGKLVIDATNPLGMVDGAFALTVGHDDSGGEQVARWATGAAVFKAMNQIGAEWMADTSGVPLKPVMFVAGDDAERKAAVLSLVGDLGFDAIDAGPLSQSRLLEPLAMLWISMATAHGLGRDFAFALMQRG